MHSPAEQAGLSEAEVLSRLHQHPPIPMPLYATQAQRLRFIWGFTARGFHQRMRLTERFGNRKNKQEDVSPLQSSMVYRQISPRTYEGRKTINAPCYFSLPRIWSNREDHSKLKQRCAQQVHSKFGTEKALCLVHIQAPPLHLAPSGHGAMRLR